MRMSLFLSAVLFAAPLHAEVAEKSAAGFAVRGEVSTSRTPQETWATLTAPAKWWDKAHSWSGDAANLYMDVRATGCFCELLPRAKSAPKGSRSGSVEHMRILYAESGKLLRMSGALGPLQGEAVHGTLTVTIQPVGQPVGQPGGSGSRLTWEYVVGGYMRFPADQIAPAVDGVLTEQFKRLAAVLGSPPEAPAKAAGKR